MSSPQVVPYSERVRLVLRTAQQLAVDYGHESTGLRHVLVALTSPPVLATLEGSASWELQMGNDGAFGECVEWSPAYFPHVGLDYNSLVTHFGWKKPSDAEVGANRLRAGDASLHQIHDEVVFMLRAATQLAVSSRTPRVGLAHIVFATTEMASRFGLLPEQVDVARLLAVCRNAIRTYYETVHPQAAAAAVSATPGTPPGPHPHRPQSVAEAVCTDLTELAAEGKLDPVVGRDSEITRLITILLRRSKHNAALLGSPGVGKTALVEGLAQRIAASEIPAAFSQARVLSLDVASLEAGARMRGDLEEKVKGLLAELSSKPHPVILFVDEMHTLMASGRNYESSVPTVEIFKPVLARPGNLRVIGATTFDEWRRVEKDAAFARRFQPVVVDPLGVDETVEVLSRLAPVYAAHHNVVFSEDVLRYAAETAHRYLADKPLPDPAISLIDGAAARRQMFNPSPEAVITKEDVAAEASEVARVPIQPPSVSEAQRLLTLEEFLSSRVVGQQEAISAVSRAVRRRAAGFRYGRRVAGAFLFVGPSGVGKTATAKALAEFLFSDPDAVVSIDMSEYMEDHSISRLIGSPPGYVGHDEGGQLTKALARKPYSVVLFDEVEKASPQVLNVLLQMLEEGRLTDGAGKTVDCSQCYVIATSNVGAHAATKQPSGFVSDWSPQSAYQDALSLNFAPELRNRFDEIVVFSHLTVDHLEEVVDLELAKLTEFSPTAVEVSSSARTHIAERAARGMGPRDIRRILDRSVRDDLSTMILERGAPPARVCLDLVDDSLVLVEGQVVTADAASTFWPESWELVERSSPLSPTPA